MISYLSLFALLVFVGFFAAFLVRNVLIVRALNNQSNRILMMKNVPYSYGLINQDQDFTRISAFIIQKKLLTGGLLELTLFFPKKNSWYGNFVRIVYKNQKAYLTSFVNNESPEKQSVGASSGEQIFNHTSSYRQIVMDVDESSLAFYTNYSNSDLFEALKSFIFPPQYTDVNVIRTFFAKE